MKVHLICSRDGDDFLDGAAQSLAVVVPVQELTHVWRLMHVAGSSLACPAAQERARHGRLGGEDDDRDGTLACWRISGLAAMPDIESVTVLEPYTAARLSIQLSMLPNSLKHTAKCPNSSATRIGYQNAAIRTSRNHRHSIDRTKQTYGISVLFVRVD